MRVLADVDEADVGKIDEGMDADCVVDAFPGDVFHGTLSPDSVQPEQRLRCGDLFGRRGRREPRGKASPGNDDDDHRDTHEVHGVPRIPNAALRYRPTPANGSDGKPVAQAPEVPLLKNQGRVWVLSSDRPGEENDTPRIVSIGITDGMYTEVTDSSLTVGTRVVTDATLTLMTKKNKKAF